MKRESSVSLVVQANMSQLTAPDSQLACDWLKAEGVRMCDDKLTCFRWLGTSALQREISGSRKNEETYFDDIIK